METVLITGANRGIGLALTRRFARGGYKVIACCRRPESASTLNEMGSSEHVSVCRLDVADEKSVSDLSDLLGTQTIDILINNAGVFGGDKQDLDNMDYAAWRDAMEVNTFAPLRVISALRRKLAGSPRPRVLTISSQMGSLTRKSKGSLVYRSSKAAVNKVMQVLALELQDEGIITCPVHPGWVRTEMGGSSADISPEESADGIFNLVQTLTMDHSGRFWTWNGQEHPW